MKYAARPRSGGYCLERTYTDRECWSDGAAGQTGVGAPRMGYPTVYHPRGQQGQERIWCQEYRIFFLTFFSRICSKGIHEYATLYLVNKIEFGNSEAGFVIPTAKLPCAKSCRSIRALFKQGDISVPSLLFVFCEFAA